MKLEDIIEQANAFCRFGILTRHPDYTAQFVFLAAWLGKEETLGLFPSTGNVLKTSRARSSSNCRAAVGLRTCIRRLYRYVKYVWTAHG